MVAELIECEERDRELRPGDGRTSQIPSNPPTVGQGMPLPESIEFAKKKGAMPSPEESSDSLREREGEMREQGGDQPPDGHVGPKENLGISRHPPL